MNITQELIDSFTVYMQEISDTDFIDLLENSTVDIPDLVDFASVVHFNDAFKQLENKQDLLRQSYLAVVHSSSNYANILKNRVNQQVEIDKFLLSGKLFYSSKEYDYTSRLYSLRCDFGANDLMTHYSLPAGDGSLFEVTKATDNKNIQAKAA